MKIIAILILTVLLSFDTQDEKKITIVWTPGETELVFGALGNSKAAILESNLPIKEARQIVAQIDSAQRLIAKQAVNQMPKK